MEKIVERIVYQPTRTRLPDERPSITHKFSVAGHEGYIHIGQYPDTNLPGEIFITMAKQGSTLSGIMDAFATAVSLSLQYGVPLEDLCNKFSHMRFEPSGFTNNKQVPIAKSIVDYIFRYLSIKYLEVAEEPAVAETSIPAVDNSLDVNLGPAQEVADHHVGGTVEALMADPAVTVEVQNKSAFVNQEDAPPCPNCGTITIRSGACYSCPSCGSSSGCG